VVQWDTQTRTAVEAALNEADVLGIRLAQADDWCDVLVHVLALPETGPLDPDARRILRLFSPAQVKVLLREDRVEPAGYGPVIALPGLEAVEDFFGSLSWSGSMYGWRFLDSPSLTHDWPAQPSLALDIRPETGSHSLYWFNECGAQEADRITAYRIEGTVTFADLEVRRADGAVEPLDEFIADGVRYWRALHSRDPRLSVEAQRSARPSLIGGLVRWRAE
jgi:hypothetical protein